MLTLDALAKLAGVSQGTASRCLRDDPRISEPTRRRVQGLAHKHAYVPNRLVRSLTSKRTHSVAVLWTDIPGPQHTEFHRGLEDVLTRRDYITLQCSMGEDDVHAAWAIRRMLEHRADAIFFSPFWNNRSSSPAQLLATCRVPAICGRNYPLDQQWDRVMADIGQGARLATQYLLGLGHRRFAAVVAHGAQAGGDPWLQALRQTAEEGGGVLASDCIAEIPPNNPRPHDMCNVIIPILERRERPTAALCFGGNVALTTVLAARTAGLPVPDDLSVIGSDGWEGLEFSDPPLSMVDWDHTEWGRLTAKKMLDRIEQHLAGESPQPRSCTLLPMRLDLRGSTGPPPAVKERR